MTRVRILVPVVLFMMIGIPAYAYGDPTGGALFQVLMPLLAFIWGLWLILANKVRRGFGAILRRLRGTGPGEESAE